MTFETITMKEQKFGKNNFIEVSKKRFVDDKDKRESVFMSIARGFFDKNNQKRYKTSVSIPLDAVVVEFVTKCLKEV